MMTIKEIREMFREKLQEYEAKQTLVLDPISGHQALLKQRLHQLYNSHTYVKTDDEKP